MIRGLDSAYPPSSAALAAAHAGGVRLWAGYFAGQNILHGWTRADFDRVTAAGLATLAFCSGWAQAGAMRKQSDAWSVPICLDVEGGIRGDGSWVQNWLDVAQAGLYGNAPVHRGKGAAFYVLAAYPGFDPQATWSTRYGARPNGPCGWQWQGTHSAYGASVDAAWYDDAFAGLHGAQTGSLEDDMSAAAEAQIATLYAKFANPGDPKYIALEQLPAQVATLKAEVDAIKAQLAAGGAGSVDLTPVMSALAQIEQQLKGLTLKAA